MSPLIIAALVTGGVALVTSVATLFVNGSRDRRLARESADLQRQIKALEASSRLSIETQLKLQDRLAAGLREYRDSLTSLRATYYDIMDATSDAAEEAALKKLQIALLNFAEVSATIPPDFKELAEDLHIH